MYSDNFFEMYTLFSGFYLNNAIFYLFNELGFTLLPFAAMLVRNWAKARGQGVDEGSPAMLALKWSELEFIGMLIIMCVFVMPLTNYQPAPPVSYVNSSCSSATVVSDPNQVYNDIRNTIQTSYNGNVPKVPLGIQIAHNWSSGITYSVANAVPCPSDIKLQKLTFSEINIESPALKQVGSDFIKQCYTPAYKESMNQNVLTEADLESLGVNGSLIAPYYPSYSMIVNREFVDSGNSGLTTNANTVISNTGDYIFQCSHIVGQLGNAIINSNATWYNRIMASSTVFIEKFFESSGFNNSISDDQLVKEMIINEALIGKYRARTEGVNSWDVQGTDINIPTTPWTVGVGSNAFEDLRDAILSFGTSAQIVTGSFETKVVKASNPVMLNVFQMIFYMMLPIFIIFTGYNPKSVLQVLGVLFALEFMNMVFVLNDYIEDLVDVVYDSLFDAIATNGVANSVISVRVGQKVHAFSPIIYLALMALAGIKLNGVMNSMQPAVASMAKEAMQTAQQTQQAVTSLIKGAGGK